MKILLHENRFVLRILQVTALAAAFCAGASAQCASGGLAVVVNKANTTEALSTAQLRRLLLGDLRSWPDKKPVSIVVPEAQSAAFKCVLSAVVRMSDAEYRRYIANAEFRGEEPVELHVAGSGPAAAKMVGGASGALAIVDASSLQAIAPGVRVLRINGKQPGEAGYPL
jgi:hypothetical protein